MGGAAGVGKQFESVLGGGALEWRARPAPEVVPSGVPEVDRATGGLPRGWLTEIFGPASSGRTSLLLAILAAAGARGGLRAGGCRRRLRSRFGGGGRGPAGAAAVGALRPPRRARPESRRSADPGRRVRAGGHGFGRYAAGGGAPHFAHLVVPPAAGGGAHARGAGDGGAAIERQDLRVFDAGMRAGKGGVGRDGAWAPAARHACTGCAAEAGERGGGFVSLRRAGRRGHAPLALPICH